jgi:nicotinamidase-related amidase
MKYAIVVDYQFDFVEGVLGTERAKALFERMERRIKELKAQGWEIIFTYDTHYANYLETAEGKKLPVPHCIEGTEGWELYKHIDRAIDGEALRVRKNTFGYMDWKYMIPDAEEILIVGVCTDICVVSNAIILKATFTEIPIAVDASLCAGTSEEAHNAALTVMKSCQIDVYGE